jgi:hypothetical protein
LRFPGWRRCTRRGNPVATRTEGQARGEPRLRLCRFGLQHPHERRLVLLLEHHNVQHAEAPAAAEEQLLADLDPVRDVASPRSSPSGV